MLQGRYGLDQQVFAIVFGAGAISFITAAQFNVVLLKRFSPQNIVGCALAGAVIAGAAFVGLALAHVGGLPGFLLPVWSMLAAMGLVIPNAPALALSRHHQAAGTGQRCWAPPSAGSVQRWHPWSGCSATTSSRWPW